MPRIEYKGFELEVRKNKQADGQSGKSKRLHLDGTETGIVGDDWEDMLMEGMIFVDEMLNGTTGKEPGKETKSTPKK